MKFILHAKSIYAEGDLNQKFLRVLDSGLQAGKIMVWKRCRPLPNLIYSEGGIVALPLSSARGGEGWERRLIIGGAIVALILLFLQIFLGAWTSTNYASLSCPDFPFCMKKTPFAPLYLKTAFNLFSPVGINY